MFKIYVAMIKDWHCERELWVIISTTYKSVKIVRTPTQNIP